MKTEQDRLADEIKEVKNDMKIGQDRLAEEMKIGYEQLAEEE